MPTALRAEFPVLERLAYFNAGSIGPVPRSGAEAARAELQAQLDEGRSGTSHFDHVLALADLLRHRVAELMGCSPGEVALTGATTDGVNAVVSGLELSEGDEVLTSDEEHPGVLAPLAVARRRRGIAINVAPFEDLAEAVGPRTRLVACSHVSWLTGRVADVTGIAAAGAPVLLDGAQALGAIDVDVKALGCDFYAASGQKWLCGPVGSGYLYVRAARIGELAPAAPGYGTLADPATPLDSAYREGAARFDAGLVPSHHSAWAIAALEVLAASEEPVHERGPRLASRLAELLEERGLTVAPRGQSTLVSFESRDPEAEVERLMDQAIAVRNLPGTPYVRASVGAWSEESELERLADSATSSS